MNCAKCNAANPDANRFCGACGAPLEAKEQPVAVPGEVGAYYCARHKREVTRVRCGRCDTPICPRCTVHGPAGVRCRDCARNRVPLRPMGVLHEAGRTLEGGAQGAGRGLWYLGLWGLILGFFSGLFGGRRQ